MACQGLALDEFRKADYRDGGRTCQFAAKPQPSATSKFTRADSLVPASADSAVRRLSRITPTPLTNCEMLRIQASAAPRRHAHRSGLNEKNPVRLVLSQGTWAPAVSRLTLRRTSLNTSSMGRLGCCMACSRCLVKGLFR